MKDEREKKTRSQVVPSLSNEIFLRFSSFSVGTRSVLEAFENRVENLSKKIKQNEVSDNFRRIINKTKNDNILKILK